MKNLPLIGSILVAILIIGGSVLLGNNNTTSSSETQNVTTENGTQVISITAKGGFAPKLTTAKAETPTVIKVKTNGTYDCSSTLNIPVLGISRVMEPTDELEIQVPPQKSGSELLATCSMGMYNFSIQFI